MADTQKTTGNGLGRWLLGGLVAGGIVLGLLIGAYEVGYDRGRDSVRPPAQTEARPAPSPPETRGGLVERGEQLFARYACASCHSVDGSPGAGPTVKGLAGSRVRLDDGTTVTADDAYLAESVTDPDAKVVEGYRKGVMTAAVAGFDLASKPLEVQALVAYMKAKR